mmetsp:Transcript_49255/g.112893  ORF Transcript_49255/g.112893 Transcript_49255/m.112893 type:complete len:236 (+) Transcript_49255:61-768(+)
MQRALLVALAAIAAAPSTHALDEAACMALAKKTFAYVSGWDKEMLGSMLQAMLAGGAKQLKMCDTLGFNANEEDEATPARNSIAELAERLSHQWGGRDCQGICTSIECLGDLHRLRGVSDLACKGLALLDCAGGLTAALERSCDAIQHEAALGSPTPSLGATSPHASPGASPQINVGMPPAAQIFLACVVLAPMVAVAAQLVKGRRRTAADLSFPGLPQSDLASAAAAASASELL